MWKGTVTTFAHSNFARFFLESPTAVMNLCNSLLINSIKGEGAVQDIMWKIR